MPTPAQLAAEQAQRVAQAMLLLEQQQADEAEHLGGGAYQGASIPTRYGPIRALVKAHLSTVGAIQLGPY